MATLKQKKAVEKLVEIGRKKGGLKKVNMGKILVESGYSEETAKAPTKVTRSKGWDELMEQYLPDRLAAKTHRELLQASDIEKSYFPATMSDKEIEKEIKRVKGCIPKSIYTENGMKVVVYWKPDSNARKAGLDMLYKLKGKYSAEKVEHTVDQEIRDHLDKLAKILP